MSCFRIFFVIPRIMFKKFGKPRKLASIFILAVIIHIARSPRAATNYDDDSFSLEQAEMDKLHRHPKSLDERKKGEYDKTIVILGAGPTGLGAAYRAMQYRKYRNMNLEVFVIEQQDTAGGLASSFRDKHGFLWDLGVHVGFSHYPFYDKVLKAAVKQWNWQNRSVYAFFKGSSGKRKFIPYPVQDNVMVMDKHDRKRALADIKLIEKSELDLDKKYKNFDEWLVGHFGPYLTELFMRKYNKKVWTVETKEMNSVWVGERVAKPTVKKILANLNGKDSAWGPNKMFRIARFNGTGQIWKNVAKIIGDEQFLLGYKAVSLDINSKTIKIMDEKGGHKITSLKYDALVNTMPLDLFMNLNTDPKFSWQRRLAGNLKSSITHILGIGLLGEPPPELKNKTWLYLPDTDSYVYRLTMFSLFSDDHVPEPGKSWSILCEVGEPAPDGTKKETLWSQEEVQTNAIRSLEDYGFIESAKIKSVFYHRLSKGYPVPSVDRDTILGEIQPILESHGIFSRGRFGGWKYEVANQDHSFMQGIEAVDRILLGIPEETYPDPNLVNARKGSDRGIMPVLKLDS